MSDLQSILSFIADPSAENFKERFSAEELEQLQLIRQKLSIANAVQGANEELIEGMRGSQAHTFQIIKELKEALSKTMKESHSTQWLTKGMYSLTFLLGLTMFIVAIIFAFQEKQFFTLVFGGLGMVTVITYFIANPPLKIQDSRSNYAQLNIAALAWFNDFLDRSAVSTNTVRTHMTMINSEFSKDVYSYDVILQLLTSLSESHKKIAGEQIDTTKDLLLLIERIVEPSNAKVKSSIQDITEKVNKLEKKDA